jgi:hypothetical protein
MQTIFLHIMANTRKKKKFIHSLESDGEEVLSQAAKQEAIYKHFLHHTSTYIARQCSLNFTELGWETRNLKLPFTMEELKEVIMLAPKESTRARWFYRTFLLNLLANFER